MQPPALHDGGSRQLFVLAIVAAVAVVGAAVAMYPRASARPAPAFTIQGPEPVSAALPATGSDGSGPAPATAAGTAQAPEVVVHVAGAVKKPGVYRFKPSQRVDEAITAAGGARTDANLDAVNLAARLEDGQQLYVPTRAERPSGPAAPSASATRPSGSSRTGASGKGKRTRPGTGRAATTPVKFKKAGDGTLNLNTADTTALQRLPGVGPAMAERILAWRTQHGQFKTPDELMEVSGIGEKKFEKMRPFVTTR